METKNPDLTNSLQVPTETTSENKVITSDTQTKPLTNQKMKKVLVALIVFILMVFVGYGSFYYGRTTAPEVGKNAATKDDDSNKVEFVTEGLTPQPKPTRNDMPISETPGRPTVTKIVLGQKELDGFMASNGTGSTTGVIRAGRNVNSVTRGFVSFDLTQVPTGVTVKAASLRLFQNQTIGNPYATIGDLRVDHINYGDSLEEGDYALPALVSNFATLSTSKNQGWKEADVTETVRDDFANGRSQSQFRIHFGKETLGEDITEDMAIFISADATTSVNQPQLVIEYY